MKKIAAVILSAGLVLGFTAGMPDHADAKAKTYKNCTALNKVYKGGVAKSKTVKNKGGKTKYKPHVSKALYTANKSKDRDKDGIACEK